MRRSLALISASAGSPRAMTMSAFSAPASTARAAAAGKLRIGRASPEACPTRNSSVACRPRLAVIGARVRESPSTRFRIGGSSSIAIGRLAYISGRVVLGSRSGLPAGSTGRERGARTGRGGVWLPTSALEPASETGERGGSESKMKRRGPALPSTHDVRPRFPWSKRLALDQPRRATARNGGATCTCCSAPCGLNGPGSRRR